jgi:hypothetical protein
VWLLVNNPIARNYDLSSLKLVISSAAPLSGELRKKFDEIYHIPIKQAYGTYFGLFSFFMIEIFFLLNYFLLFF